MSELLNQGITVMLGGREYNIHPLTIDKDLEWRRQVGKFYSRVTSGMGSREPQKILAAAAESVSAEGLDEIINSMFLLEGWDGIDVSQCSRLEIMKAALEVYKAYYAPFVALLTELAVATV